MIYVQYLINECFFNYSVLNCTLSTIFMVAFFISMIALSARLGIRRLGILIYLNVGTLVIPYDFSEHTIICNILKLKYITQSFSMEEIPIEMIKDVEPVGNRKVLIRGAFGKRCLCWRSKIKRDACVTALNEARHCII